MAKNDSEGSMFTADSRERIRTEIMDWAKKDTRLSGGAVTGSATVDRLDTWSDIDLAFGVRGTTQVHEVLDSCTSRMYETYNAIHHLDVHMMMNFMISPSNATETVDISRS